MIFRVSIKITCPLFIYLLLGNFVVFISLQLCNIQNGEDIHRTYRICWVISLSLLVLCMFLPFH